MLILISLFIAGYYFFVPNSPKEIVNDKIGINQVVAQYLSGSYSEIIVLGESLQAKKPERTETVGNKSVAVVDIDKVMLPPKDSLKDLGFNVAGVATKITVKDDVWGKFIANVLPTLLLFILLIAGFMLFMGKM